MKTFNSIVIFTVLISLVVVAIQGYYPNYKDDVTISRLEKYGFNNVQIIKKMITPGLTPSISTCPYRTIVEVKALASKDDKNVQVSVCYMVDKDLMVF